MKQKHRRRRANKNNIYDEGLPNLEALTGERYQLLQVGICSTRDTSGDDQIPYDKLSVGFQTSIIRLTY